MFRNCGKFVGFRLPFVSRSFRQGTRRYSSRKKCLKVIEPICDLKRPDVCKGKELNITQRQYLVKPKDTMWDYPDCCANFCPGLSVRMDERHYKMSDMMKRDYQQTWISCPPLHILNVEVCPPQNCEDRVVIKRRKRARMPCDKKEKIPATLACPQGKRKIELMTCLKAEPPKNVICPKIPHDLPECITARKKTDCKVFHPFPITCKKDPAPYPSFSECKRERPPPLRPIECKCLVMPAICEVWELFRQRYARGKHPGARD
uniref:Uncharacterized protein n=1 Tax=Glossina brevipalpis TaxID=37001 RepID=A0A1A9WLP7_9MUSC